MVSPVETIVPDAKLGLTVTTAFPVIVFLQPVEALVAITV